MYLKFSITFIDIPLYKYIANFITDIHLKHKRIPNSNEIRQEF